MFKNIQNSILWDYTRESVKNKDMNTPQINSKGQTQRYLEVIGSLIKDHFDLIEQLNYIGDADRENNQTLNTILFSFGLKYIPETMGIANKRHIVKYYPYMSSLLGTEVFVKWLLWMVLGWELLSISINTGTTFLTTYKETDPTTYIYDSTKGEAQYIVFDKNALQVIINIKTNGFVDQKAFDWVKANIKDWITGHKINFV